MHVVNGTVIAGCRRQLQLTTNQHNDRASSNDERKQLDSHSPAADAAAINACARIGHIFQRRLNATAETSYDPLTSIGHLRTGQYYRWNPDISHIHASRSSVAARTALYKTDVSASADSAASSLWQHKASDNASVANTRHVRRRNGAKYIKHLINNY